MKGLDRPFAGYKGRLANRLLRAGRGEAPPQPAFRRALAFASIVVSTTTAAPAASSGITVAALLGKWVGIGMLVGLAVVGGHQVVQKANQSSSPLTPSTSLAQAEAHQQDTSTIREPQSHSSPGPSTKLPPQPSHQPHEPLAASNAAIPQSTGPAQLQDLEPTTATTHDAGPTESQAPTADVLTRELRIIDQARGEMARGDTAAALRTLDRYKSTFPRRHFDEEATVVQIEALVTAGDRDSAQALGKRFLDSHQNSPAARRVRSLIGQVHP